MIIFKKRRTPAVRWLQEMGYPSQGKRPVPAHMQGFYLRNRWALRRHNQQRIAALDARINRIYASELPVAEQVVHISTEMDTWIAGNIEQATATVDEARTRWVDTYIVTRAPSLVLYLHNLTLRDVRSKDTVDTWITKYQRWLRER